MDFRKFRIDRMYLYGEDFPIHISYGEINSKVMYLMKSKNWKLIPKNKSENLKNQFDG